MYLVPNKISGNSIPHFAKRDKEKRGRCTKCCVQQPLLERFPVFYFSFRIQKRFRQQGWQRCCRREQPRQSRRRG